MSPLGDGEECIDELDCVEDEVCVDGTCRRDGDDACIDDGDCRFPDDRCVNGLCRVVAVEAEGSDQLAPRDGCVVATPASDAGGRAHPDVLLLALPLGLLLLRRRRPR